MPLGVRDLAHHWENVIDDLRDHYPELRHLVIKTMETEVEKLRKARVEGDMEGVRRHAAELMSIYRRHFGTSLRQSDRVRWDLDCLTPGTPAFTRLVQTRSR